MTYTHTHTLLVEIADKRLLGAVLTVLAVLDTSDLHLRVTWKDPLLLVIRSDPPRNSLSSFTFLTPISVKVGKVAAPLPPSTLAILSAVYFAVEIVISIRRCELHIFAIREAGATIRDISVSFANCTRVIA